MVARLPLLGESLLIFLTLVYFLIRHLPDKFASLLNFSVLVRLRLSLESCSVAFQQRWNDVIVRLIF